MPVKEKRALFTADDKKTLSKFFAKNPYPTPDEKAAFSERIGKSVGKINNWFKNERARKNICHKKSFGSKSFIKTETRGIYYCKLKFKI